MYYRHVADITKVGGLVARRRQSKAYRDVDKLMSGPEANRWGIGLRSSTLKGKEVWRPSNWNRSLAWCMENKSRGILISLFIMPVRLHLESCVQIGLLRLV